MKKTYFLVFLLMGILVVSCKKDDDPTSGPTGQIRDRVIEAGNAEDDILDFLETHFYNYEEFAAPPADFDFRIKIDTLAGDNAMKTPLIDQVSMIEVEDRVEEGLIYDLYYLNVLQGEGEEVDFPDVVQVSYEGREIIDNSLFDGSVLPVTFDLTQVVNGFQDGISLFNTSTGFDVNPDGTVEFDDFGVGAVFLPSGLGYYETIPRDGGGNTLLSSAYAQIYFTFQVYLKEVGDQDNDTVPSSVEDVNGNGIEEDDDTDNDGFANYFDVDDDNDGILTREEVEVDADGNVTYPDTDGDGTPDYLDPDN